MLKHLKPQNVEVKRILEMSDEEVREEWERVRKKMVSEGLESLHITVAPLEFLDSFKLKE